MKPIMAVCDADPFYAHRLAEFANQRNCTPFMAVAFTSLGRLKSYSEKQGVRLLLVSEELKSEEIADIPAACVICLGESGGKPGEENHVVYKYQPSDFLLREVMACYEARAEPEPDYCLKRSTAVIGIYSPVKRCGKTGFALTLGQILARESRVLFATLEEYSGLSGMMGVSHEKGLSDLIYQFRQKECCSVKPYTSVYRSGDLDYIPPVAYAEDLMQITGRDLICLLDQVAAAGDYEILVLDLGQALSDTEALLQRCNVIYTPTKEDALSRAKLAEWRSYLSLSGQERLEERIRFLELPNQRVGGLEHYLEQLLWGEMGDYIRCMLKGQDVEWIR